MKHSFEENPITDSSSLSFDLIDSPCSPGMDRRVDVAERPLIRRNLTVRVHVPLPEHQNELFLGEGCVDKGKRNAMECQVPRGIPGIFPFVRHGDDIGIVEMCPVGVPPMETFMGRV